jgi:hypothetical protein
MNRARQAASDLEAMSAERGRFRVPGLALALMLGAGLLTFGVVGHGHYVQLPEASPAEAEAEPEEAFQWESAFESAGFDWLAALEGNLPGDDARLAALEEEQSHAEGAGLPAEMLWRSERWLIDAASVGGIRRDGGGQLLQTYQEGEKPSLCPT